jgi:hypothetical protein
VAVLVISEFPGATSRDSDQWVAMLGRLRRQPGLVLYADGPFQAGWRIISVWSSRRAFQHFYDAAIRPNLPPGAPMRDAVSDLHRVVVP